MSELSVAAEPQTKTRARKGTRKPPNPTIGYTIRFEDDCWAIYAQHERPGTHPQGRPVAWYGTLKQAACAMLDSELGAAFGPASALATVLTGLRVGEAILAAEDRVMSAIDDAVASAKEAILTTTRI